MPAATHFGDNWLTVQAQRTSWQWRSDAVRAEMRRGAMESSKTEASNGAGADRVCVNRACDGTLRNWKCGLFLPPFAATDCFLSMAQFCRQDFRGSVPGFCRQAQVCWRDLGIEEHAHAPCTPDTNAWLSAFQSRSPLRMEPAPRAIAHDGSPRRTSPGMTTPLATTRSCALAYVPVYFAINPKYVLATFKSVDYIPKRW